MIVFLPQFSYFNFPFFITRNEEERHRVEAELLYQQRVAEEEAEITRTKQVQRASVARMNNEAYAAFVGAATGDAAVIPAEVYTEAETSVWACRWCGCGCGHASEGVDANV